MKSDTCTAAAANEKVAGPGRQILPRIQADLGANGGQNVELRDYLRILQKRWWVVLAAFLSTTVGTAVFTLMQAPTYQAEATYIVAPSRGYGPLEDMVDVLDAMSRRAQIAGTYARVAASGEIKRRAAEELRLSDTVRETLSVESRLLPDTNVIEITVEGPSGELVKIFADAVGTNADSYVQQLYEAYGLTLLEPASVPTSPVRPTTMLNLALGAALGLSLAVGLPFLFEYLDTTLHSTQEIEAAVNLPTLAQIPATQRRRQQSVHSFNGDPRQADAFLRLRTRILAREKETPLQTLVVTSARPGEGKSTVVAYLAVAMAQSGRSVIAVDADLRRPTLHRFFDLPNLGGLSDIVENGATLDETVQSTELASLRLLSSGRPSLASAVDLLSSSRMEALLQELAEQYDMLLIDTPALLSVTDAAVLAPMADGILLVVGCAQATENDLRTTYRQLADVKAKVAGVVMNRVRRDGSRYYYDYYTQSRPVPTREPLTKIPGIGPVYEKALNQLGIVTFGQLAKQNPEKLAERMALHAGGRRVACTGWVEQAKTYVRGKERDALSPEENGREQDQTVFGLLYRALARTERFAKWSNRIEKQDGDRD